MDILKNESDDAGCILDKSNSAIIQDIVSTVNEIDTKYITSNFVPPEPGDFCLESTTIWSFPDRGCWATHNSKYREKLVSLYTQKYYFKIFKGRRPCSGSICRKWYHIK